MYKYMYSIPCMYYCVCITVYIHCTVCMYTLYSVYVYTVQCVCKGYDCVYYVFDSLVIMESHKQFGVPTQWLLWTDLLFVLL